MISTEKAIILARKNLESVLGKKSIIMESSARLCLSDAILLFEKGDYKSAKKRAADSLKYSVGVFHEDYKRVVS